MPVVVDVQYACDCPSIPDAKQITDWGKDILKDLQADAECTIRIVDVAEGARLNERWRKAPGPTNVLAFPVDGLGRSRPPLLGDIVICAPVVATEAKVQGKSIHAHWAHMMVHGILHLLGYDHADMQQAARMEALEIKILSTLGYENPYT